MTPWDDLVAERDELLATNRSLNAERDQLKADVADLETQVHYAKDWSGEVEEESRATEEENHRLKAKLEQWRPVVEAAQESVRKGYECFSCHAYLFEESHADDCPMRGVSL